MIIELNKSTPKPGLAPFGLRLSVFHVRIVPILLPQSEPSIVYAVHDDQPSTT